MRQTKLSEYANGSKPPRVTRGHSDLPKEEPKPVQSESSSEEIEESNNPPKQKKIHHMTLKAMQRKRKLAEEAAALGISLEPKPEVPKIPKKRGRPKGYRVKKPEERDQFQIREPINPEKESTPQKKEFALRKRDPNKKIVDQDSEALQRELEEMELEKERENQEEPPKPLEIQKPAPIIVEEVAPPPAPKKRGRKKKVVVQATNPVQGAPQPALKLFTVPKVQTYDNYNKYYDKLMQVRKEETEQEQPLIFNKFMDPQGYEKLLKSLK